MLVSWGTNPNRLIRSSRRDFSSSAAFVLLKGRWHHKQEDLTKLHGINLFVVDGKFDFHRSAKLSSSLSLLARLTF
jgi:hypothetical protein